MLRRYQSYWNRFSQPDPYDGSYNLTDPQSFNRYSYTQNDPVNFVDPSGLDDDGLIWNWLSWSWTIANYEHNYNPSEFGYANGSMFEGDFGSEMGLLVGKFPPQDPRPPKEQPPKIIEKPKKPITCEEHERAVFNKEVKEVEAAAAKHFEERKGPRLLVVIDDVLERILSLIPSGEEVDLGDGDSLKDLLNKQARITEIEEGKKRAAEKRDDAIQKCKKP